MCRPPTTVALGGPAFAAQAGDYHSLALGAAGEVFGWGNDSGGQLGRSDLPLPHADCDVRPLPVSSVTALGAGLIHSTMAARNPTPPPRADAAIRSTSPD